MFTNNWTSNTQDEVIRARGSNYIDLNLRLCNCVVGLNRREAPLTDIFLGVRVRSTSEPQSLRTLPTDQQVFLGNSPVNSRLNPRSRSREANCSTSSLDLTEMDVQTLWKNSGSQLKHNHMNESKVQDIQHHKPSDIQ